MQVALEVKRKQKQKTKPVKSSASCAPGSTNEAVPQEPSLFKSGTTTSASQIPQQNASVQTSGGSQSLVAPENAGPQHNASSSRQPAMRVASAPPDLSPDKMLTSKVSVSNHQLQCWSCCLGVAVSFSCNAQKPFQTCCLLSLWQYMASVVVPLQRRCMRRGTTSPHCSC